jgi:hypothetical protein
MAMPGYDLIHQDTRGPVFDLGIHLDSYDGSVYIHQDDIIEMGRTLGMATAEEVAQLMQEIQHLRSRVNKLPKAEEELRSGMDSLVDRFYRNLHSDESNVDAGTETAEQPDDSSNEDQSEAVGFTLS